MSAHDSPTEGRESLLEARPPYYQDDFVTIYHGDALVLFGEAA